MEKKVQRSQPENSVEFFFSLYFVFVPSRTPARVAQLSAEAVRCFPAYFPVPPRWQVCSVRATTVSYARKQTGNDNVKFAGQLHWRHACAAHRTPLVVAGSRLQASFRWLRSLARFANVAYVTGKGGANLANFTRFERSGSRRCHRNRGCHNERPEKWLPCVLC